MPMPIDYRVDVPDIGPALSTVAGAIEQRRERKRLSEIGGMIQGGQLSDAAGAAFAGGDMRTGLAVSQMDQERQSKIRETLGRFAQSADTPEKWQQYIATVQNRFPGANMGEYADFGARDAVLAEFAVPPEYAVAAPGSTIFNKADPTESVTVPGKRGGGGISFTQNPDGTVEFSVGGDGAALTGPTTNTVQGKAVNMAEMGSRISGVMSQFKPEYLTLGTKVGNLIRSGKAKLNPDLLDEGDKQALGDYAKFRSAAIGNVNRLLNELSGAAVSPAEAERLKAEVPNPGTGVFDGDDPVSFKAKAESVMNAAQAALARYKFYQAAGVPDNLEEIPLNDVKKVGNEWFLRVDGEWTAVGGL